MTKRIAMRIGLCGGDDVLVHGVHASNNNNTKQNAATSPWRCVNIVMCFFALHRHTSASSAGRLTAVLVLHLLVPGAAGT